MIKKILVILLFLAISATFTVADAKSDVTLSKVVSLMLEGNFKKAGKIASKLEKRLKGFNKAEKDFVIGYLKFKMGAFEEARTYFEGSIGLEPIPDYPIYFLGQTCLELKDNVCAKENFEKILTEYPESIWANKIDWSLAQLYYNTGAYSQALLTLKKVKPKKTALPDQLEYDIFKAKNLSKLGKKEEAANILIGIYYAGKDSQGEAVELLSKIETPASKAFFKEKDRLPNKIKVAEAMLANDRNKDAVAMFEEIYNDKSNFETKGMLANAYFKTRDYEKAKEAYTELTSKRKGRKDVKLKLRLAKSAARTNDFETAIGIYQDLLGKDKKGSSLYKYKLGFLYFDSHRYKDALKIFKEMINSGYQGSFRKQILWLIAWSNYKLERFEEAAVAFDKIIESGFGKEWRTRAKYWMAVCYEKLGDGEKAMSLYGEIQEDDKLDYYGFLATRKLKGKIEVPELWKSESDDEVFLDPSPVFPPVFDKAVFLKDIGLKEFAVRELEKIGRLPLGGISETIAAINFARECSDYRLAHLLTIQQFKYLLYKFPSGKGLRKTVWENWYPDAYPVFVKTFSKEYGAEMKLVDSIMREESRFQTSVVSKADAVGLMQIIPPTARKLAASIGVPNFQIIDLYQPVINIRLGTKYLADLTEMFNGEKAYVIASYNAGEDAVRRWIKASDSKDTEEFIEEIPYDETNKYVKRVLKTYWTYNYLY